MDREPDRLRVGAGRFDSVALMRREQEAITHAHTPQPFGAVRLLRAEHRASLQKHDPFVLLLVVPEPLRRTVPLGNDALDPNVRSTQERLLVFLG